MSKYTKEDIKKFVQENEVNFIRLQFTDILGTIKNVEGLYSSEKARKYIKQSIVVKSSQNVIEGV